jgi:predicted PurR-regulated permease PerM
MIIEQNSLNNFTQKVFLITKIGLVILAGYLLILNTFDLFLLIFAGILVAIFFNGLAQFLSDKTSLSQKWSLAVVCLVLTLATSASIYFMAPSLFQQFLELKVSLPRSAEKLQYWLSGFGLGEKLQDLFSLEDLLIGGAGGILSGASSMLSIAVLGITQGLILLVIGIYMAVAPQTYKGGLLKLFPKEKRARMNEVLNEIDRSLKWWLIGRFIDMAFIGFLVWLGLVYLNVPMALILALIAAVLNFIPNIGPFLGAFPAMLIGLSQDPQTALHVGILFFFIQSLESGFITPLVQQKAISLPPALTIAAQILLGATYGIVGLLVATPLLAAFIVIVKRLYVNDILKDEV